MDGRIMDYLPALMQVKLLETDSGKEPFVRAIGFPFADPVSSDCAASQFPREAKSATSLCDNWCAWRCDTTVVT